MVDEWSRLCRAADLRPNGKYVDVEFLSGRRHRVSVTDESDLLRLTGIVVRRAVVAAYPDLPIVAWTRNRATALVGFRIDESGRLIGEASVPKVGLTAAELQALVRTVAAECDRFEYLLTGRDVE